MAMTAGKTWEVTAWTGYYPGYGEMHVTWTFQQFYDAVGNYSQIYLTNIQCYHTSGSISGVYVSSRISCLGSGFMSYGNLGGATIGQGISFPVVSSQKIYHDEQGNGTATVTCDGSVSCQDLYFASELNEATMSVSLFIPRASELSVANGTLGVEQMLMVKRKNPTYTHTISYECGSVNGTICTKSTETAIPFRPGIELAMQNISGTTVPVTFTIQTYLEDSVIGNPVTVTATMEMPDNVAPTISDGWAAISPVNVGSVDGFICYAQGHSKAQATFDSSKITMSYGASIASYSITLGTEATGEAPYQTGTLETAGTISIKCMVTDTRGRSAEEAFLIEVQPYSKPVLTDIQVYRSNSIGTADDTGLYIAVSASAVISSLNGENTKTLQARYKTSTGSYGDYQTISDELLQVIGDGGIAVTNSYVVELLLTDGLGSTAVYTCIIPTESVFFAGRNGGNAAGFGKHPEGDDMLDLSWNLRVHKDADVAGKLQVSGNTTMKGDVTAEGNTEISGDLSVNQTAYLKDLKIDGKSLLDLVYPIGTIYTSQEETSPALLFGGTWVQLQDRFLIAAGDSFPAGSVGGTSTHVLVNENMPAQSMRFAYLGNIGDSNSWSCGEWGSHGDGYASIPLEQYTANFGNSQPINHMNPYSAVYMWQRLL